MTTCSEEELKRWYITQKLFKFSVLSSHILFWVQRILLKHSEGCVVLWATKSYSNISNRSFPLIKCKTCSKEKNEAKSLSSKVLFSRVVSYPLVDWCNSSFCVFRYFLIGIYSMELSQDTIIEAKEELLVSPLSGENPIRRTAYFIKPCMEGWANPPHYMFSFGRTATVASNPGKLPLEVIYRGWHNPNQEWNTWVQQMQQKYEYMWIKTGIDQAIKASIFLICRNDELILELAQRWCSKTNTFVFSWGEAFL